MSSSYSYSYRISVIALFSVLLAISSLLNKYTYQASQLISSIIYATGIILAGFPGSAFLIALIAGAIYMFQSILGILALIAFILRGVFTEIFFILLGIYHGNLTIARVSIAMMIASFLTGISFYLLFVHVLRVLPDWGLMPFIIITSTAVISNGVGGFLTVKYIIPLIKRIVP